MAAIGDGGASGPINLQLRLVNGAGYINFDPLDAISGGQLSQSGMKGWVGLDLAGAVTQMLPMMQSLASSAGNGSGSASSTSPSTAMDDLKQIMSLPSFSKYYTVTRQADANGAAVFVTSVDVAALLSDPDFQQEAFAMAQSRDSSITQDQFDQRMNAFLVPGTQFTVTLTRTIDLNTKYLLSGELVVAANVDMAQAADSTTSSSTLSEISLDGSIQYSNFDSVPAISAPDGATMIPLSALFNGGSSQ